MAKKKPARTPHVVEGNATRLPKNVNIVPAYLTNSVTDNVSSPDGVRARSPEGQDFAKHCVDENHL